MLNTHHCVAVEGVGKSFTSYNFTGIKSSEYFLFQALKVALIIVYIQAYSNIYLLSDIDNLITDKKYINEIKC